MESKSICVKLLENVEVTLASDSPDLKSLVQAIADHRDEIDVEQISVDCDEEMFDKKGFADIVAAATRSFLEEVRIDKEKLDIALGEIAVKSDHSSES